MPAILHLADAHIGAPYDNLPAPITDVCRAAQLACLESAIRYTESAGADAILIAGDLFDKPQPPASLANRVFEMLSRAQCPVLISPGNHDYLHPQSPYLTMALPQNVHVFTRAVLEPFPLGEHTVVWGAGFQDTAARISLDAELSPNQCNLLLVHADLLTDSGYNPVAPSMLANTGFAYAAFGHNHTFSGVLHAGATSYACPGCPMGRGWSEDGLRGFLYGEISAQNAVMHFIPAGGVTFTTMDQTMSGLNSDRDLSRALIDRITRGDMETNGAEPTGLSEPERFSHTCLSLTLTGERDYTPDLAGLQRTLSKLFLYAEVRDDSVARRDLWRYDGDDDLRGAVTRRLRAQYNAAVTDAQKRQARYALQIALAALNGEALPSEYPETPGT